MAFISLSSEGETLLLDSSNSVFGPRVPMEQRLPGGAEPTPQFGPASAPFLNEIPVMANARTTTRSKLCRAVVVLGLVATCGWSLSLIFFAWKLAGAFLSAAGLTVEL